MELQFIEADEAVDSLMRELDRKDAVDVTRSLRHALKNPDLLLLAGIGNRICARP